MEIALLLSAAESTKSNPTPFAKALPPLGAGSPVGIQAVAADDLLLRQIAATTAAQSSPATDASANRHPPVSSTRYSFPPGFPDAPYPTTGSRPLQHAGLNHRTLAAPSPAVPPERILSAPQPPTLPAALPTIGKDGKLKRFLCPFPACAVRFGQKGSLTRHIRSRHEQRRPHACNRCEKSFSEKWTLDVHVRNVHLKQQPHACATCGKCFGERWNLQKHINVVHKRIKPFRCGVCDRAFGYKGDMRKHVNELHRTPGRPFRCEEPGCGVNFARLRYLRRHQNTAHRGKDDLCAEKCDERAQLVRPSSSEVAAQESTETSTGVRASTRAMSIPEQEHSSASTSADLHRQRTDAYSALHALSSYAESVQRAEAAARR